MTTTQIEISCPHCGRVYRLRLDLKTLSDTRSSARCGRCGKRFSLSKRARDSKTIPAIREEEIPKPIKRRPLRRRGAPSSRPPDPRAPEPTPAAQSGRPGSGVPGSGVPKSTLDQGSDGVVRGRDSTGPPRSSAPPASQRRARGSVRPGERKANRPGSNPARTSDSSPDSQPTFSPRGVSPFARRDEAPTDLRRSAQDTDPSLPWQEGDTAPPGNSDPPRGSDPPFRASLADLSEPPLRASIAEPFAGRRSSTPRFPSEPPPNAEPMVASVTGRRRTKPHLVSPVETPVAEDEARRARLERATDPDLQFDEPLIPPPPAPVDPLEGRRVSDPALDAAPVGEDVALHVAPVEMSLLPEDLTPVPSEIVGQSFILDPDEWLARADPGLDALSAARSEAAEALRWLLEEDRG